MWEQGVANSARPLSDITDERVVPLDYLATLMVLFIFMVLDRLFYSLGLCLGKVWPVSSCCTKKGTEIVNVVHPCNVLHPKSAFA